MNILLDTSPIPCKKYPTFEELKAQTERTQLITIAKMKSCPERDFLDSWIYDKYYSKKQMKGNLTNRIQNLDNLICYRKIVSSCLNNNDILQSKSITQVLKDDELSYFQEIHTINPSLFGTFIDYLLRRMIAEIANIPFKDCRSDRYSQNHNCDTKLEYYKHSRKELLELCKKYQLKKYHKLDHIQIVDLLNKNIKTCKYESYGCNTSCSFILCQKMCLEKIRNIQEYKTDTIVKEIFIVSLIHSECFGFAPQQESFDAIWDHLEDTEKINQMLIIPLKRISNLLVGNTSDILLNPAFGGILDIVKTGIASDADLVIGDTLIDIKCTKITHEINEFLQLFGYSSMCLLNPQYHRKINKLQILNILHGTIKTYSIDFLTIENCVTYIRMLTKDDTTFNSEEEC
jgi:hypothetical protein